MMKYARWVAFLVLSLIINFLAYLLAPILPTLATKRLGLIDNANASAVEPRLPVWLSWFQTPDNSLYGDTGWRTIHCPERYASYWGMVLWLWRNPAYGFEWSVLSARINPAAQVITKGDPDVQNGPSGKEGYCLTEIRNPDGVTYWHWCWVKRIGASGRCWHVNFGWKLKTYAEDMNRIATEPNAMFVFSPRVSDFTQRLSQ